MISVKRMLCCFLFFASTTMSQAHAWHGPCGFSGHGYGFGLNHHSFHPSIYNPGWSSYSRSSFYSSYGYGGLGYSSYGYGGLGYGSLGYGSCWPRASYQINYRSYAPVCYTNSWPTYYTSYYAPTYYAPTYCAPMSYSTYYTPSVTPVIYSNYSGFPSCAVSPSVNSFPVAAYSAKKPGLSSAAFRLASQPAQHANTPLAQPPVGRYVLAQATTSAATAALDTAPEELMAAADAILAAGGYRQAAQAYAQIVVKFGNSDRLVTRRFIAQVANGDFDQAAVVSELAAANGNRLDRSDVPRGNLQIALGDSTGLIAARGEKLAAIALQQTDDAVPMLTVAHWLALSGDNPRADLFKARADQMRQVAVGHLIHKPTTSQSAASISTR